jgi:hypothetical protein
MKPCAINAFAVAPNGALLMTGPQKAILGLALQHRLPKMFAAVVNVGLPFHARDMQHHVATEH